MSAGMFAGVNGAVRALTESGARIALSPTDSTGSVDFGFRPRFMFISDYATSIYGVNYGPLSFVKFPEGADGNFSFNHESYTYDKVASSSCEISGTKMRFYSDSTGRAKELYIIAFE